LLPHGPRQQNSESVRKHTTVVGVPLPSAAMMRESLVPAVRTRVFELIAVFFGVALAFLAEDLRDSRAERREERALLLSLRDEMRLNQAQMEHRLDLQRRARVSTEAVMNLLESQGADGTVALVPDTLLAAFVTNATYDPARGSIDAILSGGQLSLIEDPVLRSQIAAWPAVFENVNSLQILQRELVHTLFSPTLARTGVNLGTHWRAGTPFFQGQLPEEIRSTATPVPATAEVKTLLAQRFQVVRLVAANLQGLSDFDTQLLERLNAQLDSF